MSKRPAAFTQADVERMIRAAKAEGRPFLRIIAPDGKTVAEIPTVDSKDNRLVPELPPKPEGIVL